LKKLFPISILLFLSFVIKAQVPEQAFNELNLQQLIEKKAEYNRLSGGGIDGYRIKIHFGVDSEQAKAVRSKFTSKFTNIDSYVEYQQPNFVILVGDYKTKLEAFNALKKIQVEVPNAFIVKDKIKVL
jgi:hypothetical protein